MGGPPWPATRRPSQAPGLAVGRMVRIFHGHRVGEQRVLGKERVGQGGKSPLGDLGKRRGAPGGLTTTWR